MASWYDFFPKKKRDIMDILYPQSKVDPQDLGVSRFKPLPEKAPVTKTTSPTRDPTTAKKGKAEFKTMDTKGGISELERIELATARAERAGAPIPILADGKFTDEADIKARQEEIEAREEQARLAGFQGETGSGELGQQLAQDILGAQPVAPQGLAETIAEMGLEPVEALAQFFGRYYGNQITDDWSDEMAKTTFGKGFGLATVGAGALGVMAAGVLAAGAVSGTAAGVAIKGSVFGTNTALRTAVAGLALYTVGGGVFDYRGKEMDNLRQGMQKMVEDGERLEAANRNGLPSGDTIELLNSMAEEVSFAESRIQELGKWNLQYRVSKEYILDMQRARSAREAILRRVLAVENTAATGQAQFSPEKLLYTAALFENE